MAEKEWLKELEDGRVQVEFTGGGMTVSGAKVQTVSMREPTIDDHLTVSEMKASETIQELHMLANLCEVAPEDIRTLSIRNYKRLTAAFEGFIYD